MIASFIGTGLFDGDGILRISHHHDHCLVAALVFAESTFIPVGKKAADGIVEYKLRRGGDNEELSADEAADRAIEIIRSER